MLQHGLSMDRTQDMCARWKHEDDIDNIPGGSQGNKKTGVVSATASLFFKTALLRYIPKIQSFEVDSSVVFSLFSYSPFPFPWQLHFLYGFAYSEHLIYNMWPL